MLHFFRYSLLAMLLCIAGTLHAQEDFFSDDDPPKLPLDSMIKISITGRDTTSLEYYSLYNFDYTSGKVKLPGQIMIARKDDIYKGKQTINTSLCRVTHFVNSYQGLPAPPMEVGDYIELERAGGGEKLFFNFDPEMPNAVYTICEPKNTTTAKH